MNKLKLFTITIVLMFTTSASFSQGTFSIHIGPTIPMDDFGDDDVRTEGIIGLKAGGAGIGLGLGFEYTYPLTKTGLGLFFGIDINYNGTNSDYKDNIVDASEGSIDEDDITFPSHFNIPISAGLNYTFKADKKLSVYTNLGLVSNFYKRTDFILEDFYGESALTFDLANSFGMKIGGGIILNDKTYISLNYFGLGKHKIKVQNEYSDIEGSDEDISKKMSFKSKINMLTLTVGFRL